MVNQVSVNIILKQLEDILIVQGEKMENQDLLKPVQYVEKRKLKDTKDTYTMIVKFSDGRFGTRVY